MFRRLFHRPTTKLFQFCDYSFSQRPLKIGLRTLVSFQRVSGNNKWSSHVLYPLHLTVLQKTQQKCFWGVSVAFNKVDEERVRLAGPDRAAAEWVLRNGGSIRWKDSDKYLRNYNLLPRTDFQSFKIEDIDLTGVDVIGLGFQHLENLNHVKSIKLHGCRMIMDDALGNLHFVKDTLQWLEVSRCPMITEKGLETLQVLENLKTLVIYDLFELRNFDDSVSTLSKLLPSCQILSDDPLQNPENDDASPSK